MTLPRPTLEALAVDLARALAALAGSLDAGLFARLGTQLPLEVIGDAALQAAMSTAADKAGALEAPAQALADAIAAGDTAALVAASGTLLAAIGALSSALADVGTAINAAAAAQAPDVRSRLQALASTLAARAFEAMLVDRLGDRSPSLAAAMSFLGLMDRDPVPGDGLDALPPPAAPVPPRLHLDRLPQLLFHPDQHLKQVFGWGDPAFDGAALLRALQVLLQGMSVPASIHDTANEPPTLEAFVFGAQADRSSTPPGLRVELALPADVNLDQAIAATAPWKARMQLAANFAAGARLTLRPPLSVDVQPSSGDFTLALRGSVSAEQDASGPLTLFGSAGGVSLQARSVGLQLAADAAFGAGGGTVTPAVQARIDGGALVLKGSDGDSLLQELLPGAGALAFDLLADWSPATGLRLGGSAGGEVQLPARLSLGAAQLNGLRVGLRAAADGGLEATATTQVTAGLGPVQVALENVGVRALTTWPSTGGNLGIADVGVALQPPTGAALSIDAQGLLSGGGLLLRDDAKSLYAGAMQLSLQERLTLKAYGLITTRLPDGSRGCSMLAFITAEDFQPIPLGLGFNLLGIGGMVGVHRSFDEQALRQGLKNGTLATLLFPRDPAGNAAALIQGLSSAFPARRGSHLLGLLAKIGWFTPTLVLMDLTLVLEFGNRSRLLALGRISAQLPSADNDLVRLNMEALGVIDLDAGTAAIDAVLVDSRLAHQFPITGAAALRAGFGAGSNFVLAVGGLNPHFTPPAGFPRLQRAAIALSSGNNPRLLCEAYFAITANTVQFGARASLYASAIGFSVEGDIGFDVLLQLAPLHFIADYHAKLQLKRGSHKLFMVEVAGELEGPRPLRLSGKASFKIFWFHFSVSFDATLVHGAPPPLPEAVDVAGRLRQALLAPTSWQVERGATPHGVALRSLPPTDPGAPLVLDPIGRLTVMQQVVPLNTGRDIERFGAAPVRGERRFSLGATLNGRPLQAAMRQAGFAPAQYFAMSDDEKLAAPSFENHDAGASLGTAQSTFDAARVVSAPLAYRTVVVKTAPGAAPVITPAADHPLDAALLPRLVRSGAAGRAAVRRVGRARFRNDGNGTAATAASVQPLQWTVRPLEGGAPAAPLAALAGPDRWSDAQALARTLNRGRAAWQLVPQHELA